ncbi:MAG: hypothetical protein A3J55_03980 [Candidatus Ryanbacteria bacterium RIFCSPHIGHO2_02_FULL_45_17b]|uniref:Uncharacterized protein n=1 Tax=Candidatus Ryanbacteria bacterium RIFCSPHIGHO2_01_FULL_45_22 TaxID=1802114 RepID=A0A1G2FXJ1_9BACT|nr:MAG: hypothetical protein A2719_02120 [Candidatus Ryanbacteria bacterium RIFCSPHIGHO2_01_FULL_45_22]OGZ46434.1 MAG: hypothetical protein A3J55_03980 [Candidatus Ryanbacteria bacterium RIFCSPHIGHO2_02_FULL_45_17b]
MFVAFETSGAYFNALTGWQCRPLQVWIMPFPLNGVIVRAQKRALTAHSGCFIARGAYFCHEEFIADFYFIRNSAIKGEWISLSSVLYFR